MKTNTTKLRRALTAFAMTGAMLAISELCPAAEHFSTDTTIEKKNETVDAEGSKYYTADDSVTVNADFTGSTFSNVRNDSGTNLSEGSIISGGNWIITGGTFQENRTETINTTNSGNRSSGGAVFGSNISLKDVIFNKNVATSGNTTGTTTACVTQALGGAVASTKNTIIIFGNSTFDANEAISGHNTDQAKHFAIGGAVAGAVFDSGSVTIGQNGVKDSILFKSNKAILAGADYDGEGAQGGAVGTNQNSSVYIFAEADDSIEFYNNLAQSGDRAQGGAISVGRTGNSHSLTINAEDGSKVLFESNQVILESGTRAYGGAIYVRGGSGTETDLTNITFTDNSITMNTIGGTKGQGGAVFVHKGGDLNVSDSTFTGNYIKNTVSEGTANGDIVYGGALASSEGGMNLTGTNTFEGNYVSSILGNAYGGAMAVEPGADHAIAISGNNTFDGNTASGAKAYGGAIFGKDVKFSGANSKATFTGNTANGVNNDIHVAENGSVTITEAGTYSFGGGITTDAGGTLTISDGANVTFENGSITDIQGAMTLAGANLTLNIDDATKFTVGSITDNGGNTLNVNYSAKSTTTIIGGDVSGLNTTINFTDNLEDGQIRYISANGADGLVVTVNTDAGTFNRLSGFTMTSAESLNGLGTAVDGDQIIVTKNATLTPGDSIKVPANLTISSNNSTNRTIDANKASGIFTTAGTSALTLENITITGAYREGLCVYGSVISGGSWNIIGGEFTNNKTYGKILPTQDSDHVAKGGAIYGDDLNLQDVTFTGNIVEANDETFRTDPEKNTMSVAQGGAVHGNGTVNISGNSDFTGNQAISGDVTDTGRNRKDPAIGGAISGQTVNIGNDGEDKITFSGNIASSGSDKGNTTDLGGSIGGAIGSDSGAVNVTAQNGDSIIFEENKAVTKNSRALGGAIGAGRNGYNSTVAVKAEDGGEILFQNNEAASENGTLPVMGGAIYTDGTVIAENAEFNSNHVKFNVSDETKDAADGNYDDQTVASAAGGAIAVHSNYNNTAVQVKDSVFTGNTVEVTGNADGAEVNAYGGAVAAFAKDGKGTSTIEVSGKNVFENNSVSNSYGDAKGGAIYGEDVAFVGDGSNATFTGNTANGVKNDVHAESSVKFDGNGEYTFGGGITTGDNAGMEVNGSTLNFEAGSITDIAGTVGLKDAKLNITATDETVFNARDVKLNGDNNKANLTFAGTEQWTMGADFGDALVNKSSDFTTVKSENGKTVVSFRDKTNGGSNFVAMTKDKTTGAAKFQGGAESMGTTYGTYALQENDYIIATADGNAPSAVSVDGLTIKSSDDTVRTITGGTITGGTGTVLSDISSVNLKNVTLKSSAAATIDTKKALTVNADGKSTVDSINAASVNVGGNGQLYVSGSITGDTTVLKGANLAISQQENAAVTGALTVDTGATLTLSDIAMTFEEVKDANDKPVLENGKPVKTPVVDTIEIGGAISFADDAVIEISFDETFNLDAPGTYEIMKGTSLVDKGAEFSFVNAIAEMDGMQMLEVSLAQNGALMLNVKGFGTVPEPSTWALLILGGLGVFGVARKNRKAKK